MNAPRIAARVIAEAATRLAGTVVIDLADLAVGPAVYKPRLEVFETLEGELLGDDDGTLVNLLEPGVTARDLIDQHGTPTRAAAALTARVRREWNVA